MINDLSEILANLFIYSQLLLQFSVKFGKNLTDLRKILKLLPFHHFLSHRKL